MRRTMRLTTRGRRSGKPRTVSVWFVEDGQGSYFVQHTSPQTAHWYRNLCSDGRVTIDVGAGPIEAVAEPLTERNAIEDVLRRVRRKYPASWIFRLLGWNRYAVAARIRPLAH